MSDMARRALGVLAMAVFAIALLAILLAPARAAEAAPPKPLTDAEARQVLSLANARTALEKAIAENEARYRIQRDEISEKLQEANAKLGELIGKLQAASGAKGCSLDGEAKWSCPPPPKAEPKKP